MKKKSNFHDLGDGICVVQLRDIVSEQFDYDWFKQSVTEDTSVDADYKQSVINVFNPDSYVAIYKGNVGEALDAKLMQKGVNANIKEHIDYNLPDEIADAITPTPLPDDHPTSQMWKEVWDKTLQHFAAEAVEYEATMQRKGKPITENDTGYPAVAPPIYLDEDLLTVSAVAGMLSPERFGAAISKDFTTNLTPEEQKAVLAHEAFHAFEPVLRGQEPQETYSDSQCPLRKLTSSSQTFETRADHHAARLGMGNALQEALHKGDEIDEKTFDDQNRLLSYLKYSGFSLDTDTVLDLQRDLNTEKPPQNLVTTTFFEPISRAAQSKALISKVSRFNQLVENCGEEEPQKDTFLTRLAKAQRVRSDSHPDPITRFGALLRTPECQGCTSDDPRRSHNDRIKTISPTGLQGFQR